MLQGLVLALLAMSLYGIAFVAPMWVPTFTAIELALGRFLVYGIISLFIFLASGRTRKLPTQFWKHAFAYSILGFVGYYFLLAGSLRLLGPTLGTLLGGLLPIAVSAFGNLRNREFPFSVIIPPLILVSIGLMLINYEDLAITREVELSASIAGFIAGLAAIAGWTLFAVTNGRFLRIHPEIRPRDWATFIGIWCLITCCAAILLLGLWNPEPLRLLDNDVTNTEWAGFASTLLALGIGTWLATLLWNAASTSVPMAILGQMVVFEILFGLLYIYITKWILPTQIESLGIAAVVCGLLLTFWRIRTSKKTIPPN